MTTRKSYTVALRKNLGALTSMLSRLTDDVYFEIRFVSAIEALLAAQKSRKKSEGFQFEASAFDASIYRWLEAAGLGVRYAGTHGTLSHVNVDAGAVEKSARWLFKEAYDKVPHRSGCCQDVEFARFEGLDDFETWVFGTAYNGYKFNFEEVKVKV